MNYELNMTMDDKCQIRQMKDFIDSLDYDVGLNCDFEGQVEYAISGEIHVYDANDVQTLGILKKILKSNGGIRLNSVITENAEWHPNYDEYKSFDWVMYGDNLIRVLYGDNLIPRSEDITDEKRWNRFLQALKSYGDITDEKRWNRFLQALKKV